MTNIYPNINTIAFHIIGTITLWNLSHMYYNLVTIQTNPSKPTNASYIGISCLCMITSLKVMMKYA